MGYIRKIKELTQPAVEPITLDEMKLHLRISNTLDDNWITAAIIAARKTAEDYTGQFFIQRSVMQTMDTDGAVQGQWWDGTREAPITMLSIREVELLKPPLASVSSVVTYDDSDSPTTVSATTYFVDNADQNQRGRVILRRGQTWPVVMRVANGMEITYVAGYGTTAASLPEDLKHGLKILVAYMYVNRGDCSCDQAGAAASVMPSGAAMFLDSFRTIGFR